MAQSRAVALAAAVAAEPGDSLLDRTCRVAARRTGVQGAAVSLTSGEDLLACVHATGCAPAGEDLQRELGEGPSITAHRSGGPVLLPHVHLGSSWPAFQQGAEAAGISRVFAFPLRRGAARLGTFTLYGETPGDLDDEQHADASLVARLLLDTLLATQAGRPDDEIDGVLAEVLADSAEIHQAAGIVSVQLAIGVGSALAVLRARAYAEGTSLPRLAADVVTRRVRLDDQGSSPPA